MTCPLKVCVGATNRLPDDESLAAFADRFLLHHFVDPVSDSQIEHLLEGGWKVRNRQVSATSNLEDLSLLSDTARAADFSQVRPDLANCIRLLRKAGIFLSDRRLVKAQSVIAAAAALAGRTDPAPADLWPLVFIIPTCEGQKLAREVLKEMLEPSENPTLQAAAEAASLGPAARIGRVLETGRALLGTPEAQRDDASWPLEVEALAREIDAGFPEEFLTGDLGALRSQLVSILESDETAES